MQNVKVVPGELQYSLVVMDIKNMSLSIRRKQVRVRKLKTWKLKDTETRKKFDERMEEFWKQQKIFVESVRAM